MQRSRIVREQKTVEVMIRLYCRKKEKNGTLCPGCRALLDYAHERLENCPFGEGKTFCKRCEVHCYCPDMRGRMRRVMRFAGPRMMFFHPWATLRHLWGK